MPQAVYWDAAAFHAFFAEEVIEGVRRVDACAAILNDARDGLILIYTSAITYTECVRIRGKPKLTAENEGKIATFFQHKFLRIVTCDREIGERARHLCWDHESLHPRDAIHVASAIGLADVFHTFDEGLLKLNGKIKGLRIEMPPEPKPAPPEPKQEGLGLDTGKPKPPRRIELS
jgi:predicted nucleic acid-binding protein